MGWTTTLLANDAEERAIVTASMNAIGQAFTAWTQLLQYPATDAPNFHKGFISFAVTAALQFVTIGTIYFLARRELRQRTEAAKAREDEDREHETDGAAAVILADKEVRGGV